MTDQNSFSFQPAPLGKTVTYHVNQTTVEKMQPDGTSLWRLHFKDVDFASFSRIATEFGTNYDLTLHDANGSKSLGYSDSGTDKETAEEYFSLLQSIGTGLETAKPNFKIDLGLKRSTRRTFFACSIGVVLLAAFVITAIQLDIIASDEASGVSILFVGFAALGLFGAWRFRPGRPGKQIEARNLLDAISA